MVLNGVIEKNVEAKNPEYKFAQDKDNTTSATFPSLEFLQKGLNFEIIDTGHYIYRTQEINEQIRNLNSTDSQYNKQKIWHSKFL
ncbi:MAG: hypothetical protein WCK98_07210 [bacterium]